MRLSKGLFHNTLFALVYYQFNWRVLLAGPADPDAPILVPASPPTTKLLVPIFMYHHVSNLPVSNYLDYGLTVTTTNFNAQLDWLQQQGYHSITQTELFDALYYGKVLPAHPMILTFDDGYEDVYTECITCIAGSSLSRSVLYYHWHDWWKLYDLASSAQTCTRWYAGIITYWNSVRGEPGGRASFQNARIEPVRIQGAALRRSASGPSRGGGGQGGAAGVAPDEVGEPDQQQRGDDPALGELVGGDPQRLGQQAELIAADRVQQRAAVMGQHVARQVGEHAEGDAHGQHRQLPGGHLDQVPALPDHQGGHRDPEQVAVVAADVQGAETRREQQGQDQPGRDQVPPQLRVLGGRRGAPLPGPGPQRGGGHQRDAEQAVRALPVTAAELVHDPGEGPGQEAERAGDGGAGLVQVGQDPRARGQRRRHGQLRAADGQQGRDGGEGQGAGQRVVVAEHGRAPGSEDPAAKLTRAAGIPGEPRRQGSARA